MGLTKKQARDLQKRSIAARIKRNIDVRMCSNPKLVTCPPWRKRESDAGYDIQAAEDLVIPPGEVCKVRTGLHIECPLGYFYRLESRSSLLLREVVVLPSIIDATYTGEIFAMLHNVSDTEFEVNIGDRVAQLIFYPQIHVAFHEEEHLDTDGRGPAGWGSSGLKHDNQPEQQD